jgi:hypothetical protein
MSRRHFIWPLALACLSACSRPDGPKPACEWPPESAAPLDPAMPAGRRHLNADALAAEDLAIRYADSYESPQGRPGRVQEYGRRRGQCMTQLFEAIGRNHGVAVETVAQAVRRRPAGVDLAVILSFALLFAYGASLAARWICLRYPLADGWFGALAITLFASIAGSACGVLLGEMWSLTIEILRVGNSHLSYRTERIPWTHHRLELFAAGVVLFWVMAAYHYSRDG